MQQEKKDIGSLFDRIAGRYDFLNHLLSLNIDKRWRRKAIKAVVEKQPVGGQCLDVAIGTADLAIELARQLERRNASFEITGIDLSAEMMNIGEEKVKKGGWPIMLIGVSAILFAWLYTATPYSLSYLGIADVFVLLYYGIIATWGTAWLQFQSMEMSFAGGRTFVYAGAVCGLLSMCVLAINNIRDIDDDRLSGKHTIPVRLGKKAALALLGIIVALTPFCAWMAFGLNWAVLVIVPAAFLYYKVLKAEGVQYNLCLMMAGIVNLIYTGFVWLSL